MTYEWYAVYVREGAGALCSAVQCGAVEEGWAGSACCTVLSTYKYTMLTVLAVHAVHPVYSIYNAQHLTICADQARMARGPA
jgi:hypothetical protein